MHKYESITMCTVLHNFENIYLSYKKKKKKKSVLMQKKSDTDIDRYYIFMLISGR
jgi:transcriptional accessory protein Tex/SPT6